MPKKNGREKESRIEKIPLNVRKRLLWTSVIIIMIIVIIFWIISLNYNISRIAKEPKKESKFKETAENLGEIIFEAKSQFSDIKEQIIPLVFESSTSTPTTNQELTPETLELIKQELEKISTSSEDTTIQE